MNDEGQKRSAEELKLSTSSTEKVIVGALLDVARDSEELKDAGQSVGRSLRTVAHAIEHCLLPLAAVNYGIDKAKTYFETRFREDMKACMDGLVSVVEPTPSIAAPALQGLAFSHEEPELKKMYLALLRTAMDGTGRNAAHPAFAHVIGQMSAMEAKQFNEWIIQPIVDPVITSLPIVNISQILPSGNQELILHRNVLNAGRYGSIDDQRMATAVTNWVRLGLVATEYERELADSQAYQWVVDRPEYKYVAEKIGRESVRVQRGILSVTPFGWDFIRAVK